VHSPAAHAALLHSDYNIQRSHICITFCNVTYELPGVGLKREDDQFDAADNKGLQASAAVVPHYV
jgi:hypothetical protein